ncbi:hypothetical protein ACGFJ7_01195 [Actinoplanes sp. NPDC048988]|uniref:hypothetical protein n=1 Tax=Actinoplanes sp. NPDC048988 TaxID=3363901 RepID=UPI003724581A
MVGVASRYGETGASPYPLPLSVDGLIVVASICLVELGGRISTLERATDSPATATASPATTASPAATQPTQAALPAATQPTQTAPPIAATQPTQTAPPAALTQPARTAPPIAATQPAQAAPPAAATQSAFPLTAVASPTATEVGAIPDISDMRGSESSTASLPGHVPAPAGPPLAAPG